MHLLHQAQLKRVHAAAARTNPGEAKDDEAAAQENVNRGKQQVKQN